ncbi:DUF4403 family protein [Pyxidicoccus sp. 3LG]
MFCNKPLSFFLRPIFSVGLLVSSACSHVLEVPEPVLPSGESLPAVPESHIELAITAQLDGLVEEAERQVPRVHDATGAWTMVDGDKYGIKYQVTRSPFTLGLAGNQLQGAFLAEYMVAACVRTRKPWPLRGYICPQVVSCGMGEPLRQARLSVVSELKWSEEWHLTSRTSFHLDYPNRCMLGFINYDGTKLVDGFLARQLGAAVTRLDARVAEATNLRPLAERAWGMLNSPQELAPGVWLSIHPAEARASAFTGHGLELSTTVGLSARPMLTVGAKPQSSPQPLPKLKVAAPSGSHFYVALDVRASFSELTERLQSQLKGQVLRVEGHAITFNDVVVLGDKGSAIIQADVTVRTGILGMKKNRGVIYFTARPVYDTASATLRLEELDYSADTANVLLQVADWLKHDTFRKQLQQRARFVLGDRVEAMRMKLEKGLNRPLGEGVALKGKLVTLTPLGILTHDEAFIVRVQAAGDVSMVVDVRQVMTSR